MNTLTVTEAPLNATCWFTMATDDLEISSNNVSCSRPPPGK